MFDVKERLKPQAVDPLRVTSLIGEVEDRVRLLRDIQQQNDQEVQAVRRHAAKLESREAELTERTRGLDVRNQELAALKSQLETQRLTLDAQMSELATQRQQLQTQVQQAERSLESARRERADLDNLRQRVTQAERDLRDQRRLAQEEWRSIEQRRKAQDALAVALETERQRLEAGRQPESDPSTATQTTTRQVIAGPPIRQEVVSRAEPASASDALTIDIGSPAKIYSPTTRASQTLEPHPLGAPATPATPEPPEAPEPLKAPPTRTSKVPQATDGASDLLSRTLSNQAAIRGAKLEAA